MGAGRARDPRPRRGGRESAGRPAGGVRCVARAGRGPPGGGAPPRGAGRRCPERPPSGCGRVPDPARLLPGRPARAARPASLAPQAGSCGRARLEGRLLGPPKARPYLGPPGVLLVSVPRTQAPSPERLAPVPPSRPAERPLRRPGEDRAPAGPPRGGEAQVDHQARGGRRGNRARGPLSLGVVHPALAVGHNLRK